MKIHFQKLSLLFFTATLVLTGCSSNGEEWTEDHGYGPITEPIDLDEPNEQLALKGKQIFETYCEACHGMNTSISGPALGDIAEKRTPEFVINYTLNPAENRRNNPIGQELSERYSASMTNTGISEEQARKVYEYLRFYNLKGEPDD